MSVEFGAESRMERVATAASKASLATGGGTWLFGEYTANEIAAVGGLAVGITTMLISAVFKYLHYRLELKRAQAEGVIGVGSNSRPSGEA